jgi:hypothetical protein
VTLPSNIISLQDEDEYINLMVYADSGVGKTVFAGSDDDVLFIAPEDNGTLSAKRLGSSAKKWKIAKWKDIAEAYDWLAKQEPIPFNWIVLDSLTEMQAMCMRSILDEGKRLNPARDIDLPLIGDWTPYYNKFERMVKAFNALPVNVLYTALQSDEEDEEGEKVVLPMMQGKGNQYAKKVASWMTSFGNMRVRRRYEGEDDDRKVVEYRQIQWAGSKQVMAKDRTRCLEPRTVDLSLKEVRELLEKGPEPTPAAGRVVKRPKPSREIVRESNGESKDGEEKSNVVSLASVGAEDE